MRVRLLRAGAGALVLVALAYPGHGGDVVESAQKTWGDAPEPALHRLLRDLVREVRERPPGERRLRASAPGDATSPPP